MRDWVTNVDTHPLPARHRRRPAPVPRDGPRLPPGHRRRGPGPGARAGRPAARRRAAPASAAAPTRSASSTRFLDDASVRAARLRGRRRRRRDRPARGAPSPAVPRACCTARALPAAGRGRPDHRVALDLGRPGLPGRRPRARLAARHRPGDVPPGHRRRGDGGVRAAVPHRGDHPGHRERARPGRRAAARPRARPGRRSCWSTSPAAATRTSTPPPRWFGLLDGDRPPAPPTSSRDDGRRPDAGDDARSEGRAALVGYLPVGFPDVEGVDRGHAWRWSRPASTSSRSACPTATR